MPEVVETVALVVVLGALAVLSLWLLRRAEPRLRRVMPVPVVGLGLAGVVSAVTDGGSATSLLVVFLLAPVVGVDAVVLAHVLAERRAAPPPGPPRHG